MSYFSDNEIMGGISVGNDQFDGSYMTDEMTDHSVYNYGRSLNPYSPIQNEPMGRDFSPNNFNGTSVRGGDIHSNYRYNPLSTYNLDTDEIYSNHMYGNPSFYRTRDAQYGNATPNPHRNSFNVEQDFMQDSVDYQAPGFKSTADRRYNKAGELISESGNETGNETRNNKERFYEMPAYSSTISGLFSRNSLFVLIIIMAVVIALLVIQNRELNGTIKTIVMHQMFQNGKSTQNT